MGVISWLPAVMCFMLFFRLYLRFDTCVLILHPCDFRVIICMQVCHGNGLLSACVHNCVLIHVCLFYSVHWLLARKWVTSPFLKLTRKYKCFSVEHLLLFTPQLQCTVAYHCIYRIENVSFIHSRIANSAKNASQSSRPPIPSCNAMTPTVQISQW